ncbi:MAG: hypothetical protein GTO14_20865, partial [Anaerolineales bacterium]|nr:hypothetical protein [Anaerolineales bacterium]
MPKSVTVTLNETEYTITELRSRQNAEWRKKLEGPFSELVSLLQDAPETELTDMQALANLVRSVSGLLLHSIDTVKALLAEYAPHLPLDDAYDSEILDAFTEVLSLAYPFGRLIAKARQLGSPKAQM